MINWPTAFMIAAFFAYLSFLTYISAPNAKGNITPCQCECSIKIKDQGAPQ